MAKQSAIAYAADLPVGAGHCVSNLLVRASRQAGSFPLTRGPQQYPDYAESDQIAQP